MEKGSVMMQAGRESGSHFPQWGARALDSGTLSDPFSLLGPHRADQTIEIRTYQPNAQRVYAVTADTGEVITELYPSEASPNVFVGVLPEAQEYKLRIDWGEALQETEDPYAFGLLLGDMDLHLIGEGRHYQVNRTLGAHVMTIDQVLGTRFAVWAPNAQRVSVVGDFNLWDGRRHPMRLRGLSGIWEIFIPQVEAGAYYKYEILGPNGLLPLKSDPVGWQAEAAPGNASIVPEPEPFEWHDEHWMHTRHERHSHHAPISIYEVHAMSWRRRDDDYHRPFNWDELADELIPYVQEMNFTHIELLPITAHPYSGSCGYQPIGMFAPIAECGTPRQFARFVDRCHQAGIGVITDWVPAHFPLTSTVWRALMVPPCTSTKTCGKAFIRIGIRSFITWGAMRCAVFYWPMPCTGWKPITLMVCGWMRWRPCCTGTIPVSRGNGCRIFTVAGRTWKVSSFYVTSTASSLSGCPAR